MYASTPPKGRDLFVRDSPQHYRSRCSCVTLRQQTCQCRRVSGRAQATLGKAIEGVCGRWKVQASRWRARGHQQLRGFCCRSLTAPSSFMFFVCREMVSAHLLKYYKLNLNLNLRKRSDF